MIVLRHVSKYLFLCSAFIFIVSCTPVMNVRPQFVKMGNVLSVINGKIHYDGNKEYMPRTVSNDTSSVSSIIIKYQYLVDYGNNNIHFANLFNPLLCVGFPTGQDTLVVAGKIDIIKNNEVARSYSALCAFEKTRNLFYHGPSFSELRKTGLLNVRDNIEAQMYKDKEALLKIQMQ